jgi:hypothetical protein
MSMMASMLLMMLVARMNWTSNRGRSLGKSGSVPILKDVKFRSPLEKRTAEQLETAGVPYKYESRRLEFTIPARQATYRPDFLLNDKFYIETKGWPFEAEDRQRLLLVKDQHPDLDLRIVFQSPHNPIYKGSKTTVSQWAESHGFKWAAKTIPDEWIIEAKEK